MTLLSIPPLVMAVVALYVAGYHFLVYCRRSEQHEDLSFACTCLAVGSYCLCCVGNYNSGSPAEGAVWQRRQLFALAPLCMALLWFVLDYTRLKLGKVTAFILTFFSACGLIQLLDRSDLTWQLSVPLVKTFRLPLLGYEVTYQEVAQGRATDVEALGILLFFVFLYWLSLHFYWRVDRRRGRPLLIAITVFLLTISEDVLVSAGFYSFVYTIEYGFLGLVLVMGYTLSGQLVDAARVKKALRESEEKYRRLHESMAEAFVLVDMTGIIRESNHSYRELVGYSEEELAHLTYEDLTPPRWHEFEAGLVHDQVLARGYSEVYEKEYRRKDGAVIPVELRTFLIRGDTGEPEAMWAIVRDLSERKRAEAELQREQARAQMYLDIAPSIVLALDANGCVTLVNDQGCRLLECPREEILGRNWFETFLPEEDRQSVRGAFASIMVGDIEPVEYLENRIVTAKRRERIVRWHNAIIRDDDGQVVGTLASADDITERRQAEEAWRESQLRFRQLFDTAAVPLCVVNRDGILADFNARFVQTFGYTHADVPTLKEWWQLAYPEPEYREWAVTTWEAAIRRATLEGTDIDPIEYRVTCKDGTVRTMVISGTLLGDDVLATFYDVTERRELESRLRQREKMDAVGQLAGGIAHDFNNQLGGILGFAEMLANGLDDDKLRGYAESIMRAAQRSADLTGQLLAFSRKGRYLKTPVDLHRTIADVVNLLRRSIDRRVDICQHLRANPSTTVGDASQLQNALLNLALNARDAMPDGGELTFSTDVVALQEEAAGLDVAAGRYLEICVTDTGTGMSSDTLKHLFEPFFTTKGQGKGTGLGLAAVYGTLKTHHGAVSVTSKLGHGTTFRLYLPSHEEVVADEPGRSAVAPTQGTGRILLVDDEETIRDMATEMLEELGYEVVTADDGEDAVARYRTDWEEIDLVILDMIMPRMGGRQVYQAMREINPGVRVLLASGYSIAGEAQTILDEGVLSFIQKPFLLAELARETARVLAYDRADG